MTTSIASSRTTRSTKKSSSDEERADIDKDQDSNKSDHEDSAKGVEAPGPSEHERNVQLDREKIKEVLSRKAEGLILEPREGSPKKPRQEDQEELEHIQADPPPSSPMSDPLAPPSSPMTPFPPPSSPTTPPSPETLDPPRSSPAPTSPQQQQQSTEPSEVPLSTQIEDEQEKTTEDKAETEEKPKHAYKGIQLPMMLLEEPTQEGAYEELEQELAQAKSKLELQKQQNKALNKEKEVVGSLASTSQISQAETHVHVQLPPMPDMPDLPSTSQHGEEHQGLALGALDVRGDLEQEIEYMPKGYAKEFLLHEKKVMESAALAFLQPEEQVKSLGHDFLTLPMMRHNAILCKEKMRPALPQNKDGGYEGIPITSEQAQALVEDHPRLIRQGLELGVKVSYNIDTAKGLKYLHHQSTEDIEDCDVKPSNILLDEDFHVKDGDFGLAKLMGTDSQSFAMTTVEGGQGQERKKGGRGGSSGSTSRGGYVVLYGQLHGELKVLYDLLASRLTSGFENVDVKIDNILKLARELKQDTGKVIEGVRKAEESILANCSTCLLRQAVLSPGVLSAYAYITDSEGTMQKLGECLWRKGATIHFLYRGSSDVQLCYSGFDRTVKKKLLGIASSDFACDDQQELGLSESASAPVETRFLFSWILSRRAPRTQGSVRWHSST
ncbi:hypothetical protein L7F22_027723 [Adiantum nelumboides]|nr:hypothetical protein [Adiantum nelumboides]